MGIGKQWDPYYNLIAAVTDIHYHSSSPFGYDNEGPFRTNNLVRYAHSIGGGVSIDAGMQVNGAPSENNAGEIHNFFRQNSDVSSDSDNVDVFLVGGSMELDRIYVGVSYMRQNVDGLALEERNFFGVGASLNVTEDLYLAATYQYIAGQLQRGQ